MPLTTQQRRSLKPGDIVFMLEKGWGCDRPEVVVWRIIRKSRRRDSQFAPSVTGGRIVYFKTWTHFYEVHQVSRWYDFERRDYTRHAQHGNATLSSMPDEFSFEDAEKRWCLSIKEAIADYAKQICENAEREAGKILQQLQIPLARLERARRLIDQLVEHADSIERDERKRAKRKRKTHA